MAGDIAVPTTDPEDARDNLAFLALVMVDTPSHAHIARYVKIMRTPIPMISG